MKQKTRKILLYGCAGLILLAGVIYRLSTKEPIRQEETETVMRTVESTDENSYMKEETVNMIGIHVTGAVAWPDHVYTLPEGSRVADAIEAAGGALEEADLSRLNLAAYLKDGQRIRIPFQGEADQAEDSMDETDPDTQTKHLTNINSATKIELMELPGIGETTAMKIIAYREEHGPFSSIEELMNVSGIGESKFAAIKELITTEGIE